MYLFSRLRNLLLLLHICFQTLAEKKNTPEKAPPSALKATECSRCSSSQKTRSQQAHHRNNERRRKPQQESKRLFFEKKSAKGRV
jgi:hypothetical protein